MVGDRLELDFDEFMRARWSALYRTAYLLTGSRHEAEDLLQDALAKTCVRWRRIQGAAVSADGSQVAVVDLEEDLVVYDLADGDEVSRTSHDRSAYVADFSDRVLYAVGDDTLRLGLDATAIDVPVFAGPAWSSYVGANTVAVSSEESGGTTRVYDVTDGSATEIAEMPGKGDLSPDGRYYFAALEEGSRELWDLEAGERRPLSGLEGSADQVRWLDEDTALVGSGTLRNDEQVSLLYACEASTQHCVEVYETDKMVWLGD